MNFKEEFKELYKAQLKETVKKSLVYALLVSASALTVTSFIFWMVGVNKYWIALIAFAVLFLASFGVTYLLNKPSEKMFAKKLDSLGLQERVITMNQYKNDDSLMARIQRQNAIDHIKKIDTKALKVVFSTFVFVCTLVASILAITTTTASVLAANGIIGSGKEVINDIVPEEDKEYEVTYEVASKGYNNLAWVCDAGLIEGEIFQVVKSGNDASAVLAVADDGYMFVAWSDGNTDPYRLDKEVSENLFIYALFAEIGDVDQLLDELEEGKPQQGEPQEGEANVPKQFQESDQDGGKPEEGEPKDGEGGGAGGRYVQSNQVIDGETYYGDEVFDNAFAEAMEKIQNSDLSDEEKQLILDYFKTIAK